MKSSRHSIKINLFCIVISWIVPNTLSAQSLRWFRKELGVAQSAVYDAGHSFAKYKGTGVQLQLGFDRETAKSLRQLNTAVLWTPLKAKVDDRKNATSATQINGRINYMYLRQLALSQDDRIQIAAGASLFVDANGRYYSSLINNQFGWDINLGVNLVGQATFPVNLRKHVLRISYQLGMPVLVYNHTPNYLGTYPIGNIFQQGESSDLFSLGRVVAGVNKNYLYLHQQLRVEKGLPNGDRVRITYSWDYSNNGYTPHRYQNLMWSLSIGILSSFSGKQASNNK